MENPLLDLLEKLRSCTNRAPVDRLRKRDPVKWAQLRTCLDTLTDAQRAINAYREIDINAENPILYLNTYGVLQAMILQQDALANVAGIFGMNPSPKKNPYIREIRDIRNKIAGHPTAKITNVKGVHTFHRIVQPSLSPVGFEAVEDSHNKESVREFINLSEVTLQNEQILSKFLVKMLEHIESMWSDHANQYNDTKLTQLISREMIDELDEIELMMQGKSSGFERLKRHIDAIRSGKTEIMAALVRRGCDREFSSGIWNSIDLLGRIVHIIQARLGVIQCDAPVNSQPETSVWIESLCSEMQNICRQIGGSSSLDQVSRGRINFIRIQDIPKLLGAIDEYMPTEFILTIVVSIKSAILDVALAQINEVDESSSNLRDVKRMVEITQVIENCVKSGRFEAHQEWEETDIDLIICLRFLKKSLVKIHELSLEMDSEYSSVLFSSNHGTD